MPQHRTASTVCAMLCVACCCSAARAEELSEREFLSEFPMVLSASRLRQNLKDAPQSVTVIDQDAIRASGVRELAELFRMVPGFNVGYSTHIKGLQPIVSYHGLGAEFFSRLQVLIDGRSMNNATLGGVDWSDFPLALDDIERVEVVRGPSNASHGIGAFLGTINFITKHPSQHRGAFAMVNAGSNGILDIGARYAGGGPAADFRITAQHQSDDGFANIANRRVLDFANVRADFQLNRTDNLMVQAGASTRDSDTGTGTATDPVRTARFSTGYAQLKWERNFDADNGLSAQLYHYRFSLDDKFQTAPIPDFNNERFPVDESSTVTRTDLELQHTFTGGPDWRFVWGGSLREDKADAPRILQQPERLRIERLFGHAEWRATRDVVMNIGAMVEHNNLTGTDIAPQVSVNWRVAPTHMLRFGASKALRTPTLFEEKVQSVVIGTPSGAVAISSGNLQPETIVSSEIGYIGEWPDWHTTLDVKVFYESLHDLIGLTDPGSGFPAPAFPRTIVNGDDARQHGIEGQLTWRPNVDTSVAFSATHLDSASSDRVASYSTSAPRNTVHLLMSRRFAGTWDASASYHWQSSYKPIGVEETQGAFSRLDLRLGKRFTFAGTTGELALVVENVFNERYTEFRPENVAQRRAWLTFRSKF